MNKNSGSKWFKPLFDLENSTTTTTQNDHLSNTIRKKVSTEVNDENDSKFGINCNRSFVNSQTVFDINAFNTSVNSENKSSLKVNNNDTSLKSKFATEVESRDTEYRVLVKVNKISDSRSNDPFNVDLLEKTAPDKISELAVHPKKIGEVLDWIQNHAFNTTKVSALLLTGPTGAGKTATVRAICKSLNVKIIEWISPVDMDFEIEDFYWPGQKALFAEFLIEGSKYPSFFVSSGSFATQVLLVEDFPGAIMRKSADFENILQDLFNTGRYSVIFISTETKDKSINPARQLFPDTICNKFGITTISFNPTSVTLLKGALKRASAIIQEKYSNMYKIPSAETADSIINSAMGDIRCAINYFNFACIKGSAELPSTVGTPQMPGSKRKRKTKDKSTLKHMSRDESLDLLHGVGRVLYPKRVQQPPFWKLERQPESVVDQFITSPDLFVSFLHENYLRYFGNFSEACEGSECLSRAEIFLCNWQDDELIKYGLWGAVMGMMVNNGHPVPRWNPVQGPKFLKHKTNDLLVGNQRIDPLEVGFYNIIKPEGYFINERFRM